MTSNSENEANNVSSWSGTAFFWFGWLTFFYFMIKYFIAGDGLKNTIWTSIYFIILIGFMMHVNNKIVTLKCGTTDYGLVMFATIIPWVFIVGITYILIMVFPGWKLPFSNTLGYLAAYLSGINTILGNILKSDYTKNLSQLDASQITPQMKITADALSSIYSDKSMLINQVTPDNLTSFWTRMKPLMRKGAYENTKLFDQFKRLVYLKDIVAEFMWMFLSGMLAISVSFNMLISSQCQSNTEQILKAQQNAASKEHDMASHIS